MEHEVRSQSRVVARRGQWAVLLATVAAAGSAIAFLPWRGSPRARVHPAEPRSIYRNTRPGVKYLGDASCVSCHREISETYRRHPMGRSLAPIAAAAPWGDRAKDGRPLFEAQGFEYGIESRDGRVIHTETRSDTGGRIVSRNEAEVRFVLGSGRQGVAFLIERDGFLFESPITWYPQDRKWDLSPGYESNNSHFSRPILSECLFCHANQVEPVAGTVNRYHRPIFRGHAIGCERCHGPGELHVADPTAADGRDMTIVNPGLLEPSLREAVCEQCHLIGQKRIVRAGRREQDFRPGLPFQSYWSVLELAGGSPEDRFVGQVEQMHESRCFRDSQGRLGCISCHDPHRLPEPQEKVVYYRGRCLQCHGERGCTLPSAARLARSRDDNCFECHMPRSKSSDILHVATTNHRIPRDGEGSARPRTAASTPRNGYQPLVGFHRFLTDARERAGVKRDIGVALSRGDMESASVALPLLDAALAADPGDVPAWEAKAMALGRLDRAAEGLAAMQSALAKDPGREASWVGAAYLSAQAGRRDDAIASWHRAIAISPFRPDYHAELALVYFGGHEWSRAAESCRETLRYNPAHVEVRKLLIQSCLELGDERTARAEFDTLMGFNPPDRDALVRWFASRLRSRSPAG